MTSDCTGEPKHFVFFALNGTFSSLLQDPLFTSLRAEFLLCTNSALLTVFKTYIT